MANNWCDAIAISALIFGIAGCNSVNYYCTSKTDQAKIQAELELKKLAIESGKSSNVEETK